MVEQPADLRTECPPQSKSAISDDDPDVGDSATRQQCHDLVKLSNKDHDWFVRKLSELGCTNPIEMKWSKLACSKSYRVSETKGETIRKIVRK